MSICFSRPQAFGWTMGSPPIVQPNVHLIDRFLKYKKPADHSMWKAGGVRQAVCACLVGGDMPGAGSLAQD